jgi:hypothetical protein
MGTRLLGPPGAAPSSAPGAGAPQLGFCGPLEGPQLSSWSLLERLQPGFWNGFFWPPKKTLFGPVPAVAGRRPGRPERSAAEDPLRVETQRGRGHYPVEGTTQPKTLPSRRRYSAGDTTQPKTLFTLKSVVFDGALRRSPQCVFVLNVHSP